MTPSHLSSRCFKWVSSSSQMFSTILPLNPVPYRFFFLPSLFHTHTYAQTETHTHTKEGAAGVIMSCKLPSIARGLFTCNQPHGASVQPAFNMKLLSAKWRRGHIFCTSRNVVPDNVITAVSMLILCIYIDSWLVVHFQRNAVFGSPASRLTSPLIRQVVSSFNGLATMSNWLASWALLSIV